MNLNMKIVLLADIHIGAIKDSAYVYNVIQEIIEKEIGSSRCDALIILGDYFDRLFKANEQDTALAINIMSYIVRRCKSQHTKIRIVYGTEGHEMGQYKLFNYHLTSRGTDMKVIETATEEELFPGVNVLYLPEEYIQSKGEFYKDTLYSGKQYDYIFGHGMIVEGVPESMTYGSRNEKVKHVPWFSVRDFESSGAQVFFGHYHQHVDINDHVHYIGSLFRYKFGEESPKGYGVIEDGNWEFIENKRAYKYYTVTFEENDPVYTSAENLISAIQEVEKKYHDILNGLELGKIRLVFNMPSNAFPEFKDTIRSILLNRNNVVYLVKDIGFLEECETETEKDEEKQELMSYLLEPKLDVSSKINLFLKEFVGGDISLSKDDIVRYITDPLEL